MWPNFSSSRSLQWGKEQYKGNFGSIWYLAKSKIWRKGVKGRMNNGFSSPCSIETSGSSGAKGNTLGREAEAAELFTLEWEGIPKKP